MPFETMDAKQEFLDYAMHEAKDKFISLRCYCNYKGKRVQIPLPSETYEEKVMSYHMLKVLIAKGDIKGGMCILGESFLTHVPKDVKVDMQELMATPAEQRPYTSDCLLATFIGPKGQEMFISKVEKVEGERKFGNWEKMEGMQEGLLAGFYTSAIASNN